jgi:hypothetical protein
MTLHRSRRRDTRALDYGRYWLEVVLGDNRGTVIGAGNASGRVGELPGLTLDDVEATLTGGRSREL